MTELEEKINPDKIVSDDNNQDRKSCPVWDKPVPDC